MRPAVCLVVVLILCAPAHAAEGLTEPTGPPVGRRVRITSGVAAERVIGTVLSVELDAVVLRHAGSEAPSRIPIRDILKLEVSGGQKSQVGRGALIGAAVGVMPGLLLTFGDYSSDVHGDSHAATVAAIGAASGVVLGAAIGFALKTDEWVPSEVPRAAVAAFPLPGGAAVSFRMTWGNGANDYDCRLRCRPARLAVPHPPWTAVHVPSTTVHSPSTTVRGTS